MQSLNELFAGLSSQDPELQAKLAGSFEKLDIADALQKALDSGETSGLTGNTALMDRIGKALGIDDPAAFLKTFETSGDQAGFAAAIESYIAKLMGGAGSLTEGMETSPMVTALQGLINDGMLTGLEFDETSVRDKLALVLGKWNLPQLIADALTQTPAGGAPGSEGSTGSGAVEVPVAVTPVPQVEDAPGAVKAAVEESLAPAGGDGEEGAPAVSVEVPVGVTPAPVVQEGSAGKLVDAMAGAITAAVGSVTSAGDAISRAAAVAFRSQIGSATTAGRDMVQGLINGAEEKRGALISKFEGLIAAAIAAAKHKAGISSPSKVFRGMGHNIADSFALGVDERSLRSQRSVERLVGVPSRTASAESRAAQAAIDYDKLAAASSSRPVYLYVDGKRLAQATAADNTRAISERQRRLDIGKGLD